jgi:hypothetical protein
MITAQQLLDHFSRMVLVGSNAPRGAFIRIQEEAGDAKNWSSTPWLRRRDLALAWHEAVAHLEGTSPVIDWSGVPHPVGKARRMLLSEVK